MYIYIYIRLYIRVHFDNIKFLSRLRKKLAGTNIFSDTRIRDLLKIFHLFFFSFFPIVCDQFAERNKLLGDRSGWDPIEGRGTDGDKSGRDLLVRTRDFR